MNSILRCAVIVMLAMGLVACQTEVVSERIDGLDRLYAPDELSVFFGPDVDAHQATQNTLAGTGHSGEGNQGAAGGAAINDWGDSCASNLDEITGSLLAYYSTHQRLPPTLDAIPKISPSGARISLTCPVSGKQYIYHPEGLRPPLFTDQSGETHVGGILILYDPEPSHRMVQHLTDGTNDYDVTKTVHLGIVLAPSNGAPNAPIQMSVEHIEPGILDMYLRNNPSRNTDGSGRPVAPVW